MRFLKVTALIGCFGLIWGCANMSNNGKKTFGDDVAFIKKHMDVVVLSDSTGQAKVCVVPALQGRVMTSSAAGDSGTGYGWVNYELFRSGKTMPHINVYGGEDRFWMGPEGGQFSIFFKKGVPFDLDHWFTPASIDTEPFDIVVKSKNSVVFKKDVALENYSGTAFKLRVDREVRVLEGADAAKELGLQMDNSVRVVAFQSINRITNTGRNIWDKNSGMLSIWILGMFNPSPATTVVVPYEPGSERDKGPVVNDAYFGKVPADRLVVSEKTIYFSCDGKYRSKIGLSPSRSKPVIGSYDAVNKVLTVVQYTKPEGVSDYVNSMWEIQKDPFKGDVVNSYNDGPAKPGAKPLGPFYELESSSPAASLNPGESLSHTHRTIHLLGSKESLDKIAETVFGVDIAQIEQGLKK